MDSIETIKDENLKIYTVQETAKILKINEAAVRKAIHRGELQASRVGKRLWRVSLEAIRRFLELQRTGQKSEKDGLGFGLDDCADRKPPNEAPL